MSKRRHDNEMIRIRRYNSTNQTFGVIQPETEHLQGQDQEPMPCMLDCGDSQCREWTDVFTLDGNTQEEARRNLDQGEFSGAAYHLPECRMEDP